MYSYCYVYVFLLLCMFCSGYSLLLCYVYCVCKCVLYYCHRMSTQLHLTNISNIPPPPKYFWTFTEIITWVSTSSAVPSSPLHHPLGPNSFNPKDGSSTFIQKTSIKLQHNGVKIRNTTVWTIPTDSEDSGLLTYDAVLVGEWFLAHLWHCIPSKWQNMNALKECVTTSNLIYMQIIWQYWPLMKELQVQFWVTSYMTFTVDELALENTSLQVLSIISHQLPFYHCSPMIYHSCWEVQQTCQGRISSCSLHLRQSVYGSSHGREIMVHHFAFDKSLSTTF